MLPVGDGVGDGLGHLELLRPGFVIGESLGDGAVGAEDGSDGHEEAAFLLRV